MLTKIPVALLAALFCTALFAQPHPLETSVEKARAMLVHEDLGDGIHVFRAPSDLDYWTATNSVVVVDDEDVVVFDACTRALTARAVIAEIRKLTDKPVRTLVNSHWHQDHWTGNDEYAKAFPGIRIVATAETREFMSHMGPKFFVDEIGMFGLRQMRADLAKATATGKLPDGSPLTPAVRARKEASIQMAAQLESEVAATPRVLPNLVYRGEMTFWSGGREFRLTSMSGDARGSTVLYLPRERVLVTGDVLVSPEDGKGPPPWATGSNVLTPWVDGLRRLDALDVRAIVPGQGPVMHDKAYLERTIQLFTAVLDQVHAALDRGIVRLADVRKAVNVDSIGRAYVGGGDPGTDFPLMLDALVKVAMQEALDGVADVD